MKQQFTLLELLTICVIMGLLISMIVPSLNRAREMSKRAVCLSNMKQMSATSNLYATNNNGMTPIGYRSIYQLNYKCSRNQTLINQGLLTAYADFSCEFLYCPSQHKSGHQYDPSKGPLDSSIRTARSSAPLVKYNGSGEPTNSVYYSQLDPTYSILADLVSSSSQRGHLDEGINTIKVGGQGKWIRFDATLDGYLDGLSGSFSSSKNGLFDTMWNYISDK